MNILGILLTSFLMLLLAFIMGNFLNFVRSFWSGKADLKNFVRMAMGIVVFVFIFNWIFENEDLINFEIKKPVEESQTKIPD